MTPLRSLHHAQVFYPPGEEAAVRRFYGALLGLHEIPRPAALADRAGLPFEAGAGHVHLSADAELGLHPRRHFALRVDSLDALVERLQAAGARLEDATPIPGWRRTYVRDPFGSRSLPQRRFAAHFRQRRRGSLRSPVVDELDEIPE